MNITDSLFDMQKIFHRSIFDCFNEGLTKQIFEQDMSLFEAMKPKKKQRGSQKYGDLLDSAKEYVLDAASVLAGIIKDKEDSMMGNIRYMEDDFISTLREERMYRMITYEVKTKIIYLLEHGKRKRLGQQRGLQYSDKERGRNRYRKCYFRRASKRFTVAYIGQ